jgi:hypothetical protein
MATTTPNYGWPVPTSTDLVKDGAVAIEALGDAIDATVFGLGSGSLTLVTAQTVGTAVSTVTVTGAFNSTYENYTVLYNGGVASGGTDIYLTLGAANTGYYSARVGWRYSNSGFDFADANNGTRFLLGAGDTTHAGFNFDIQSPNLAKRTFVQGFFPSTTAMAACGGFQSATTQFTAFTFVGDPGITFTGGTVRVYGYKNS